LLRHKQYCSARVAVQQLLLVSSVVFSADLGLFFSRVAGFFKACGLLVLGLVAIEICLFFGLVFCRFLFCRLLFFQILWQFCCFKLLLKAYWACFYENLLILGLFIWICLPALLFNFIADFSFCLISMPTHVGWFFG